MQVSDFVYYRTNLTPLIPPRFALIGYYTQSEVDAILLKNPELKPQFLRVTKKHHAEIQSLINETKLGVLNEDNIRT